MPADENTQYLCTGKAKNISTDLILKSLGMSGVKWMRLTVFGGKLPILSITNVNEFLSSFQDTSEFPLNMFDISNMPLKSV